MQAHTFELKQILNPERRYVIPTFQRDYEWTREGQWRLLFEDLEATAERLHDAREHARATGASLANAEKGVSPHFLGAIVCDQLPSSTGGLDLRAVIDGQQRLTTIQLLIRGVLDLLIERGSPRVPQVRRLVQNPPDVIARPEEKHKLWPRRRDRLVWPEVMADGPSASDPEHLYSQARRFFADAARTAATASDGSDRSEDLVDALIGLFKLVVIDLDENDDAQVIFEVLNGRQTPLSASDLVKNFIFLRGELSAELHLESLYDEYWAEFDEAWWKTQIGTGHAARDRRDVVLSVWLTATTGREASVARLYGEIRSYLNRAERKTEELLAELAMYGRAYKVIYAESAAEDPRLIRSYVHLDRLKITTAVPLLAWLRTLPADVLPLDQHIAAVSAVESWVLRRMLVGVNTRGYGTAFLSVLSKAQSAVRSGDDVAQVIAQALADGPNNLGWPDDAAIAQAFASSRFYGSFTQERIRLLLAAIDERLRDENPRTEPATFSYDALQIEHVMPQKWQDHWPLESADPLAPAERDAAVHRIGNLTLVSSTFNQSVSNLGWEVKRAELQKQSALQINGPIGTSATWDESAIAARAADVASTAARVWPPPASFGAVIPVAVALRPLAHDWSTLHTLVAVIPRGSWTTYGDLAQVVGTSPQAVGNHVVACSDCDLAYRVLTSEGKIADGFRWTDPERTDDPEDVLRSEGVRFDDGVASAEQRMGVQRLDEHARERAAGS